MWVLELSSNKTVRKELFLYSLLLRKLKQCERKYGVAIHQATKHFAAYLLGNHTTIFTDHKALTYMETMKLCIKERWNSMDGYTEKLLERYGMDQAKVIACYQQIAWYSD